MNTEYMLWLNEEFVPVADPDDLKTYWNFAKDTENLLERTGSGDFSQIRGSDGVPLYTDFFWRICRNDASAYSINFRGAMLGHAIRLCRAGELVLPGVDEGKPSDAVFGAFAKVPMKSMPHNLPQEVFPSFDMEGLIQLIEKT